MKIKARFDGKEDYRGSLANMGTECHTPGLTQAIRKKIGKSFGDEVAVELWKDKDERIVEIPEDVQILFNDNPKAFEIYNAMSYTTARKICAGSPRPKSLNPEKQKSKTDRNDFIRQKRNLMNSPLAEGWQNFQKRKF